MQWLRKNARLRLLLAFLLMSTTAMSTNTQAEDPPPTSTTASAEETTIDLSDPQVRARLRAAGVNPDELLLHRDPNGDRLVISGVGTNANGSTRGEELVAAFHRVLPPASSLSSGGR